MLKKKFIIWSLLFCLVFNNVAVFAIVTKYPDYSYEFLGEDKLENFNRKVFNFNLGLNKYAIRPVHILWSSIMPVYGMDRISGISNNIEYPIRLVSSLLQKDFKTSKNETIRFFTNTTIGLGGMFDPAKHIFGIAQSSENMEQALAGCSMETGKYFVFPVLNFTSFRGLLGRILDTALNPGSYIGSPLLAMIKAGFTINRTSYMQPLITLVESTFADPYDIARKFYGVENYIKCKNLDRIAMSELFPQQKLVSTTSIKEEQKEIIKEDKKEIPTTEKKSDDIVKIEVSSIIVPKLLFGGTSLEDTLSQDYSAEDFKLTPDIILNGYNPQTPVVDSMRTALFNDPNIDKSMWNEISLWNRSFSRRLKEANINLYEGRTNYSYRYLLNKNKKNSSIVIIYPSIGEGILSSHSENFAKLFYDAGYSVVILGSHFQWEFAKSMPQSYYPGIPSKDAEQLCLLTSKILNELSKKYGYEFNQKVIIGTSFGALASLFVGNNNYRNNTLGNLRVISICPPINLIYAMRQVDKISEEWNNSPETLKTRVAQSAAKILKIFQDKDEIKGEINQLPFNDEEGKLITGFLMHQKLSDLIFTLENAPKNVKSDIYDKINNINFQDYAEKYLIPKYDISLEELSYEASLNAIGDYLENSDNYIIYHSLDDYLINPSQLKQLKQFANNRIVIFNNGAHLGFLYRKEFLDELKKMIYTNQPEKMSFFLEK